MFTYKTLTCHGLETYANPDFNTEHPVQGTAGYNVCNQIYMHQNVYRSDVRQSPTCFGNVTGAIYREAIQPVK
jgi:hypothetical protein